MVGGRLTRLCLPLIKMVMYSFCRRLFSALSAAVNLHLGFGMVNYALSVSQRSALSGGREGAAYRHAAE